MNTLLKSIKNRYRFVFLFLFQISLCIGVFPNIKIHSSSSSGLCLSNTYFCETLSKIEPGPNQKKSNGVNNSENKGKQASGKGNQIDSINNEDIKPDATQAEIIIDGYELICEEDGRNAILIYASKGQEDIWHIIKGIDAGNSHINIKQLSGFFYNLPNGRYQLYVTDGIVTKNGGTVNVQPPAVRLDLLDIPTYYSQIDASCYNRLDGGLTVFAEGGTPPYTYHCDKYAWPDYKSSNVFTNLRGGEVYRPKVKDSNGCIAGYSWLTQDDGSAIIIEPERIRLESYKKENSCYGENNGRVYVNASGGNGNLAYSIDGGATFHNNKTWSFASVGNHKIRVAHKNDHSCYRDFDTFTIIEVGELIIDSISSQNVTCFNMDDGVITVHAWGGTGNLQYSFDGGVTYQDSNIKTNCSAGDYYILIRDKNNKKCATSSTLIQITQPTPLGFVSILLEHPTCNGDETGRIEIFPTGGSGQYLYSFDGGTSFSTSNSLNNLNAGTYDIAIADEAVSYCQLADAAEIIEPDELLISDFVIHNVTCFGGNNGSIELHPQGGSGAYEYSINDGASWHTSGLFENLPKSTLLPAIRDINDLSCIYQNSPVDITEPDELIINDVVIENVTCFGGSNASVEIDVLGGSGDYDFSLDGGATYQDSSFFNNIPADNYMPFIRDHNDVSCFSTYQQIEVAQPPELGLSSVTIDTVTCFGGNNGNIELFAEGGSSNYEYSFDGGLSYSTNPMLDNCLAGDYNVMLRDALDNQCTFNGGTKHVPEFELLEITSLTPTDLTCNNTPTGRIEIHTQGGSGAFEYSVDNGSSFSPGTVATDLAADEYTVIIREQNDFSCLSNTLEQNITQPAPLSITAHEIESVTCYGADEGEIRLSANGGSGLYEFSIDNGVSWQGDMVFPNLFSGTYPVVLRDMNDENCQFKYTDVFIPQEDEIIIHNSNMSPADCYGWATGEVEIFASGGTGNLQYSIDNGGTYQISRQFLGLSIGDQINVEVADSKYTYCTTQGVSDIMTQVDELEFSDIQLTNVDCKGNSNGSIQINASGGSGEFEYSNDGGMTYLSLNTFTNLEPQSYNLSVRDKNATHCVTETIETITEPAESIHLQSIPDPIEKSYYHGVNVTQCGEDDGWFKIHTQGGTGEHLYKYTKEGIITDYQMENSFIGLTAGLYKVEVKDENNCILELPVVLRDTAEMAANISSIQHTGCGASNGSATIQVQGGVAPYTYYWDDDANTQSNTVNNLSAGAYRCWVYDANNCYIDVPVGISNTDAPDVQLTDTEEVTCWYSEDGEAEINIVSGNAPYEILWSDDLIQSSLRATNLMKGTYLAEVTDVNGCKTVVEVNIPGPEKLRPGLLDITQPLCFGDNNAAVAVSAVGGISDYSFSLHSESMTYPVQDGSSALFDANITADEYFLRIEDSRLCTHDETITIEEPDVLEFTTNSTIDPSCFDFSDGSITVVAQGGTHQNGNYTFTLDVESQYTQQAMFTSLEHGTYTISVEDDNACTAQMVKKLTEPPLLLVDNLQYDEPLCHGETNQFITASAIGGTPSNGNQYTFNLTSGGTLQGEMEADAAEFRHFPAGEYLLQVKDLHNCLASEVFTITEPDTLSTKNIKLTDLKCYDTPSGVISISAQGGESADGSYEFSLFKSGAQRGKQKTQRANFSKLFAGSYIVQIKDDNQCSIEQKLNLDQPKKVEYTNFYTEDAKCFHQNTGELQFGLKGGTTNSGSYNIEIYKDGENFWSEYQNRFQNTELYAGYYTIIVVDDNNCPLRTSLEIKDPPQLAIQSLQVNPVRCNNEKNGSLQLKIQGGTTIHTNYTAVLSDNEGLEITKNGGTVYYKSLQSNEYSISIHDMNNCSVDTIVTIENPPPLELQTSITKLPLCFDSSEGEIQLLASGGTADEYSYSVTHNNNSTTVFEPSGDEALFSHLKSGLYLIQLADENLCSLDSMLQIQGPSQIQITTLDIAPPKCHDTNDASLQVSGTGGTSKNQNYSYQLRKSGASEQIRTGGLEIFQDISAGEYQLIVEDDNFCFIDTSFAIAAPNELYFDPPAINDVSCYGNDDGNIKASVKGGTTISGVYSFTLSQDTQIIGRSINTFVSMNGLHAGNYKIAARDMNGCSVDSTFTISEPPEIVIEDIQVEPTLCGGDKNNSIYAKAIGGVQIQGGYLYEIQTVDSLINKTYDVSAQFNKLDGGDFYITAYDKNNCAATAVANIIEPPKLVFEAVNMKNISCFGDADGGIIAKGHGGTIQNDYKYILKQGKKSIENFSGELYKKEGLAPGSYSIILQDDNKCTNSKTITLNEPDPVAIDFIVPYDSKCSTSRDGKIITKVEGGQIFSGYVFTIYVSDTVPYQMISGKDRVEIGNMGAGEYKLKVDDFYGCSAESDFEIKGPPPLIAEVTTHDVVCVGGNEGAASVKVSGGLEPYDIRWYSGNVILKHDVNEIQGLEMGDYMCYVTDANNCPREAFGVSGLRFPFTISQPESGVKISLIDLVNPLAHGELTGKASFSANGGYGGYQYSLDNKAFTYNSFFSGLGAGKFMARVKDINQCRDSITFQIEEPDEMELFIDETENPKCKGIKTGMISVSGTGGTPPYTWSADNGQSFQDDATFVGLGKGEYSIIMKDANGYSVQTTAHITEPSILFNYKVTLEYPTACNKSYGKIAVQEIGGTYPYTYTWIGHEELSGNYITHLAGGVYSFTISDKFGCEVKGSAEVLEGEKPEIVSEEIKHVSCFGGDDGSLHVVANGQNPPFRYEWQNISADQIDNNKANQLLAGNYELKITDAMNCFSSANIEITQPDSISIEVLETVNPLCYEDCNGYALIESSGGTGEHTFSWEDGNHTVFSNMQSISDACQGVYTVFVKDSKNCTASKQINLKEPPEFGIQMADTMVLCTGEQREIEAGFPDAEIKWIKDGAPYSQENIISIFEAGKYTLFVKNFGTCTKRHDFEVLVKDNALKTNFLMTDTAMINDTIVIIDVSDPLPSKINWDIPPEFSDITFTENPKSIKTAHTGIYTIGLSASLGQCKSYYEKNLVILENYGDNLKYGAKGTWINEIVLWPNPNNGHFYVNVILMNKSRMEISVSSMLGQEKLAYQQCGENISKTFEFNLPFLKPGIYLIEVKTKDDTKFVKFTVGEGE